MLTTSKPLIYLRFLKSYNYTPTKKKRYTNVCLFFLCAALLLRQHDRPAAEHFIRLEWFRSFFFGAGVL